MGVPDLLAHSAATRPDSIALVTGAERSTYAELHRDVGGLAASLRERGLTTGDRVVVQLPNSRAAVVALFGVLAAGGCVVMTDPTAPAERVEWLLAHSEARAFIGAVGAAAVPATVFTVFTGPDAQGHDAFAAACAHAPLPAPVQLGDDDLAAIIYTSGSTGMPKGVTHTHGTVTAVVGAVADYLQHTPDDVVLSVLQLAFGYGLLQLLVTFATGGTLVLRHGFGFAFDIVTTISTERVTGFAGVPTMYALLLQLRTLAEHDTSSLRYLTNAGAALPQRLVTDVRAAFPSAQLFLMHGLTECFRTSYLPPDQLDTRPMSIGRGMPSVELWLEDSDGNRLPPPATGEMVVRGPGVMVGYWRDPAASAAVLRATPSGLRELRTGDIFDVDADGWFSFQSRSDDIIKTRGEKVSPLEIEELLFARDEVLEARVIGVPDDVLGAAIRAEVVLRDGATVKERELRRYLAAHLEAYKVPHTIAFVESLPKSPGGKIRRTL